MRERLSVLLMAAFLLFAVSACGGGGGGEQGEGGGEAKQKEQAEARAIPKQGKTLAAGHYTSEAFKPTVSFKVGNGWLAVTPEIQDALVIGQRDEPLQIGFLKVGQVFDPSDPDQKDAAPEDMAA